ncbi:MAG: hypothetical protein U0804_03760 [Gemmataceae bacterium]
MKNGVCPKCGCTVVIQGARVLDRGDGNVSHDLAVAVDANPEAWVFKGRVRGDLWACVCGACGFTELYATNLNELVKAAAMAPPKEA